MELFSVVSKISLQATGDISLDAKITLVVTEPKQLSMAILTFISRLMEALISKLVCIEKLPLLDNTYIGNLSLNKQETSLISTLVHWAKLKLNKEIKHSLGQWLS